MMKQIKYIFPISALALAFQTQAGPPNVVFVITDDQGFGDLACNGNEAINTPNIDRLSRQSVRLNNYHVDPTCAPTRAALLTGRHSDRVGVWHTIQGRNMLRRREITMADIFGQNGYATGLFGKWHLGDCYPFRPQDRGFQHVVCFSAGGIGQAPDYWGNDYFDDTYFKNGKPVRFEGFCTDVWFREGMNFIRDQVQNHKPFFAYIAPNAPHGPYYCPKEYSEKYEGNPDIPVPEFFGMIENIDDNMAKLIQLLKEEGIEDNTILVFTTDNGSAAGGFNAGMKGKKGSQYDGGHRVPFMIRWPGGRLQAGHVVEPLTAHMDILPTLIDLCGLNTPKIQFDGKSLRNLLYGNTADWPERLLVVESQRVINPVKWRQCAVMTDRWRLIDGKKLYDMNSDTGQQTDVHGRYPEVFQRLRGDYETFWADVSQEHDLNSYIIIGSDKAPVVTLCSHDWLADKVAWSQSLVMLGGAAREAKWVVLVEQDGEYEISLRRWPVEADKAINDPNGYKGFDFKTAQLCVAGLDLSKDIPAGAHEVTFRVKLTKGITTLAPVFLDGEKAVTPYYAYVTHKPFEGWQTPQGMGIPLFDPEYGRVPPQPLSQNTDYYRKAAEKSNL
ncbi:arylsulfatase [Tichowtungia aerotolerans]|nr:arylsulfatase [Tichowtungia aerotolerans]